MFRCQAQNVVKEAAVACRPPHRLLSTQGIRYKLARHNVAVRVTTAEPGQPDPATSIFTKRTVLKGEAASDNAVWPIVFTAEHLAASELYTGDFKQVVRSVTVTLPPPVKTDPAPVLVFFNGFQARASWYQHLMSKLAAAGYATVQYDTPEFGPFAQTFDFEQEMKALPPLLEWLAAENKDPSNSILYGRLDLSRLALGGHSRGGKLAALHYATERSVGAAYLLDPVDELQPAAVDELAGKSLAVGVTAAGVTGAFNPSRSNFRHFLAAAADGSQLHELPSTKHLQFCDAGIYLNGVLDTADELFTDAGLSAVGATLLFLVYLFLAGRKTSNKPLPASAALGSNTNEERVALFKELFSHMQEDIMKRHTSLQELLPGSVDEQQLQAEWVAVLHVVEAQDEGQLLEKTMLGQLASMDVVTSNSRSSSPTGQSSAGGSASSTQSLGTLSTLSSVDRTITMDMNAVVPGTDEVREKVAAYTAEAMLLWLNGALKK